jgi:hypothetical protein
MYFLAYSLTYNVLHTYNVLYQNDALYYDLKVCELWDIIPK